LHLRSASLVESSCPSARQESQQRQALSRFQSPCRAPRSDRYCSSGASAFRHAGRVSGRRPAVRDHDRHGVARRGPAATPASVVTFVANPRDDPEVLAKPRRRCPGRRASAVSASSGGTPGQALGTWWEQSGASDALYSGAYGRAVTRGASAQRHERTLPAGTERHQPSPGAAGAVGAASARGLGRSGG